MDPATIELTLKIGAQFTHQDKIAIPIDSFVKIETDPVLTPNEMRDLALYAGPGDEINFITISSDQYGTYPDKPKGFTNERQVQEGKPRYLKVQFTDDTGKLEEAKWIDVKHSMLLMGRAAHDLLPRKLERVFVRNDLPKEVKLTIVVARSRTSLPKLPLRKDGD